MVVSGYNLSTQMVGGLVYIDSFGPGLYSESLSQNNNHNNVITFIFQYWQKSLILENVPFPEREILFFLLLIFYL